MNITAYSLSEALFGVFGLLVLLLKLRDEKSSRAQKTWSDSSYFLALIASFALVFSSVIPWPILSRQLIPGLGYGGTAVTAVGLAFAAWGRISLGRLWTGPVCILEGHQLKKDGPYRITRHPMYTGIFVGLIGTALTQGEVRSVLAVALMAMAFRYRIANEERLLSEHFGAEYVRYQNETPGLIPGGKAFAARVHLL